MERLKKHWPKYLFFLFAFAVIRVHPYVILILAGAIALAFILAPFIGAWQWLVYGGKLRKKEYETNNYSHNGE